MKVTTRSLAVLLACIACAPPAAAQVPSRVRDFELRGLFAQEQLQRRGNAGRMGRRAVTIEVTEPFSRTVRLGPGGTFELDNVVGDVTVSGGRGNDARIDAVKRVREVSDVRARAALAAIRIAIAERGGSVEVRTVQPRIPSVVRAVDYVVTLPAGANVILRTGTGNVRVQNVAGEVRAETINGTVTAAALKRLRALKSVTGNIDVTDGETDELNASTLSGNILIKKLTGRLIDLHTVSGNVLLQDVVTERAILQSMAGDLEFAGRLARSGRYRFQTHQGNIRVIPSGTPGFDLDAMTFSGDLRSDFVLRLLREPAAGMRPRAQRTLRGTFGDAGAVLTASSFSGNIVITKP